MKEKVGREEKSQREEGSTLALTQLLQGPMGDGGYHHRVPF